MRGSRSRVIVPPSSLELGSGERSIFLAGSMGAAEPWQDSMVEALRPTRAVILNPRRPAWDAS